MTQSHKLSLVMVGSSQNGCFQAPLAGKQALDVLLGVQGSMSQPRYSTDMALEVIRACSTLQISKFKRLFV